MRSDDWIRLAFVSAFLGYLIYGLWSRKLYIKGWPQPVTPQDHPTKYWFGIAFLAAGLIAMTIGAVKSHL